LHGLQDTRIIVVHNLDNFVAMLTYSTGARIILTIKYFHDIV